MRQKNSPEQILNVSVAAGKYTVILEKNRGLRALRHGEEWRDCCGDSLILALAVEIEYLREMLYISNKHGENENV